MAVCLHVCASHECPGPTEARRGNGSPELEPCSVVSYLVGRRTWTRVLWKRCSDLHSWANLQISDPISLSWWGPPGKSLPGGMSGHPTLAPDPWETFTIAALRMKPTGVGLTILLLMDNFCRLEEIPCTSIILHNVAVFIEIFLVSPLFWFC